MYMSYHPTPSLAIAWSPEGYSNWRISYIFKSFVSLFVSTFQPYQFVLAADALAVLYHVRIELALQKPFITHELRMVQLPNLEDWLFYERQ